MFEIKEYLMVVLLCFTEETLSFSMLDLHMATVTGDELSMNRIHLEQEMETGLELFAAFALCSILSALTHHNQHLNEIECSRTHSPKGFIQMCCGVRKAGKERETCYQYDWVHPGVQSLLL